jgi:hypothetical protein
LSGTKRNVNNDGNAPVLDPSQRHRIMTVIGKDNGQGFANMTAY